MRTIRAHWPAVVAWGAVFPAVLIFLLWFWNDNRFSSVIAAAAAAGIAWLQLGRLARREFRSAFGIPSLGGLRSDPGRAIAAALLRNPLRADKFVLDVAGGSGGALEELTSEIDTTQFDIRRRGVQVTITPRNIGAFPLFRSVVTISPVGGERTVEVRVGLPRLAAAVILMWFGAAVAFALAMALMRLVSGQPLSGGLGGGGLSGDLAWTVIFGATFVVFGWLVTFLGRLESALRAGELVMMLRRRLGT